MPLHELLNPLAPNVFLSRRHVKYVLIFFFFFFFFLENKTWHFMVDDSHEMPTPVSTKKKEETYRKCDACCFRVSGRFAGKYTVIFLYNFLLQPVWKLCQVKRFCHLNHG